MASGRGIAASAQPEPELRLQSGRNDHHGAGSRRRLGVERPRVWITNGSTAKSGDHLGQDGGARRRLEHPRFIVPDRHAGLQREGTRGQAVAPGVGYFRAGARDVKLGKDALLPGSKGLKRPASCLRRRRYGIAWARWAAAMGCYDEALRYAKQRVMFGGPSRLPAASSKRLVEMFERDHQGSAARAAARPAQGPGQGIAAAGIAGQGATTWTWRCGHSPARRAGLLGRTGFWRSTRRCGTWPTWESVYTYEGTHDMHTADPGRGDTGIGRVRVTSIPSRGRRVKIRGLTSKRVPDTETPSGSPATALD